MRPHVKSQDAAGVNMDAYVDQVMVTFRIVKRFAGDGAAYFVKGGVKVSGILVSSRV